MGGGDITTFKLDEVSKHNSTESTWIIIDDNVYDVTKFLMEHPGGEEVILRLAGQDATDGFNDVGHSTDAKDMAKEYLIGKVHPDEQKNAKEPVDVSISGQDSSWADIIFSPTWTNFFIPLGIAIGVYITFKTVQNVAIQL